MNTYISARSTSNDKFLTHTVLDAAFFSFCIAGVSGCKIQEIKNYITDLIFYIAEREVIGQLQLYSQQGQHQTSLHP